MIGKCKKLRVRHTAQDPSRGNYYRTQTFIIYAHQDDPNGPQTLAVEAENPKYTANNPADLEPGVLHYQEIE